MSVKIMTDDNYKELISESDILITDVWAEWCSPCRQSTPVFEELAEKNQKDNVVFAKLDSDNNRDAASHMKVTSLPTFTVFEEGKMVKKWSGANIGRLRKEINSIIED